MENQDIAIALTEKVIIKMIYQIRGRNVMIDIDLAVLYGVETKQLKRAVKRNLNRFPDDFMFMVSVEEMKNLRCQIGTSSWGGQRYASMVFTEQGVAMLSSVLNSEKAINTNITIIRAFVTLRQIIESHFELSRKIEELEDAINGHDEKIELIFLAIKQLMEKKNEVYSERTPIGYRI